MTGSLSIALPRQLPPLVRPSRLNHRSTLVVSVRMRPKARPRGSRRRPRAPPRAPRATVSVHPSAPLTRGRRRRPRARPPPTRPPPAAAFRQHKIGTGTESDVYEMKMSTGTLALKVFKDSHLQSVARIEGIQRAIRHPSILQFRVVATDRHRVRAVTSELCHCDLLDHARRAPDGCVPAAAAISFAQQIAGALSHAHSRGVFHLDVKPENVLFRTARGRQALLADWGCAQDLRSRAEGPGGRSTIRGTTLYWAPEVFSGRFTMTAASLGALDAWALGATVVAIVTGQHPWSRAEPGDACYADYEDARRRGLPARDVLRWPDGEDALTVGLLRVVEALMHPDPSQRATAAVAEAALRSLLVGALLAAEPALAPAAPAALAAAPWGARGGGMRGKLGKLKRLRSGSEDSEDGAKRIAR